MLLTYPTRRASRSLAIFNASRTASGVSPSRPQYPFKNSRMCGAGKVPMNRK